MKQVLIEHWCEGDRLRGAQRPDYERTGLPSCRDLHAQTGAVSALCVSLPSDSVARADPFPGVSFWDVIVHGPAD